MKRSTERIIVICMIGGVAWGIVMSILFPLSISVLLGMAVELSVERALYWLVGGILFGVILTLFMVMMENSLVKRIQPFVSELLRQKKSILLNGAATHINERRGVSGWFFITDKELIFKTEKSLFYLPSQLIACGWLRSGNTDGICQR